MLIRAMTPTDARAIFELQQKYARSFAGAQVFQGEIYLSPGFHAGQDVFLAWEGTRLLAYAPVFVQIVEGPASLPHMAWIEVKADPDLPDPSTIKDVLLDTVTWRARFLTIPFPGRGLRFSCQYSPAETPAIQFVESHGFAYAESAYTMLRDLAAPILDLPLPEGIRLRRWNIQGEADGAVYVAARNECFPQAPVKLNDWLYLINSPFWEEGVQVGAFAGDELVGNVSAFWNEEENRRIGKRAGFTEYIFVRPAWRGNGIAGAMIAEGMRYLKERGLEAARLEVRARNDSALGLYKRLGYAVTGESRFYARDEYS
jgi:ribosomal protein S18 acetylase RimI-like enzyme